MPVHLALNVARVTRRDLTRDCGDEPERERRHPEQQEEQKEGREAELADPPSASV
jgi:hypothetical protein